MFGWEKDHASFDVELHVRLREVGVPDLLPEGDVLRVPRADDGRTTVLNVELPELEVTQG